jgi:hypothetical protein
LLLDFGQDGFSRIFDSDFDVDTRNFSLLASVIPPYVCSFKSTEKCGHTYLHSPYEDSIMILNLSELSLKGPNIFVQKPLTQQWRVLG